MPVFLLQRTIASFEANVSIKVTGTTPWMLLGTVAISRQSMIDRVSPPVFHRYLQYAAADCWKRPHALVSVDRRSIGPGSCIIPFYVALRIGDRGDGAAWRSHRRDWASGVVGHMRFLAQGEE